MPIGPYKNFAACVAAQRRNGKSLNSANRICGELEKKSRGENNMTKILYNVPIKEGLFDGKDFIIRGTAINATTTRNRVRYESTELSKSAHTLQNKPILKDHKNEVDSIVGKTTDNVFFNEGTQSIDFEGKIIDESIKTKIENGLLKSVSIGAQVQTLEKAEDNDDVVVAKGIDFLELSLVAVPADPNAGFTQAIAEAYNTKLKEENKMDEETIKVDESKADISEAVKQNSESIKALAESIKLGFEKLTEHIIKEEDAADEPEEPEEEPEAEEEPVEDKTEAEVEAEASEEGLTEWQTETAYGKTAIWRDNPYKKYERMM